MVPTHPGFIQSVGVTMAALVVDGDVAPRTWRSPEWNRLHNCWLHLDWLAQQARECSERGGWALDKLVADHRAALYGLVIAGELDALVADQVQIAFAQAAFYAWRKSAPDAHPNTLPLGADPRFEPMTGEQLRAVAARETAVVETGGHGTISCRCAGKMDASPEAIEAARLLLELLLEE